MLEENHRAGNTDIFFISSYEQPLNSDDVLEVWDRYSNEELFPNGSNDRAVFNECCAESLMRLAAVLGHLIEMLRPTSLRVFLPEDDHNVPVKRMTVDEMIDDVLQQLTGALGFIDSAIYDICC